MASGYDRWAGSDAYERYIGRWSRPVADQFVVWLEVPPGQRWLDVGCGTGALSQAILKRSAPASLVGVDPVEPFIARASAALTDPRASFRLGSAADTGLPDGAADVVVAGLVLNFVPDVGAALAEWRRVLAPGGVVGAYVWDYVRGMGFIRQFWDAAVTVDSAAAALDQGGQLGITAAGKLEAAVRAAGFEAVEARSIAIPTVFADFDDLWLPFLGGTGGPRDMSPRWTTHIATPFESSYADPSPRSPTARSTSKLAPGRYEPAGLGKRLAAGEVRRAIDLDRAGERRYSPRRGRCE